MHRSCVDMQRLIISVVNHEFGAERPDVKATMNVYLA